MRTIEDPKKCADAWMRRKECLWSTMACFPDHDVMITDVCVPLSNLDQLIRESKIFMKESRLPSPLVAHAGDGNFHVFIIFDKNNDDEIRRAKELSNKMALRAIELDGTCTGEHGIGVGKRHLLRQEMGDESIAVMQSIKTSFDPKNILNPGKVFLPPSETYSHSGSRRGPSGGCG
jgi:D-lactate dehydrogenase (cytochrome)